MTDKPTLWVADEAECGHVGCTEDNVAGMREYGHEATAAELVGVVRHLPNVEEVAWCPKHNWSRNHTDALYLCAKGNAIHDPCGQGVRVLVVPVGG